MDNCQDFSSPPPMSPLTPDTSPDVQLPRATKPESRKRKKSTTNESSKQLRLTLDGKLLRTNKQLGGNEAAFGSDKKETGAVELATQPQARDLVPFGKPPVSGERRAAICDALPYFKSHQGSVYSRNLMAYGMYVDAEVNIRDQFQSQIIITTVGGGRSRDKKTGKMIRTEDQKNSITGYTALENACTGKSPVCMVAGAGNRLFPVKTEHYFNILGYFHVTDIWTEASTDKDGQLVKYFMVRLEKIDLNTRSWWTPQHAPELDKYAVGEYKCSVNDCSVCGDSSKHIFREGWTCLNGDCPQFIKFEKTISMDKLRYNDNFLRERTLYTGDDPKYPLVPGLPPSLPVQSGTKFGTEKVYKGGIVCPQCRFASRRLKWELWECENPTCDFTYTVPIREVPLSHVIGEADKYREKKKNGSPFFKHADIKMSFEDIKGYSIRTFYLPGEQKGSSPASIVGSVSIFRPFTATCEKPGGPDDLFKATQGSLKDGEIKLRRNPAKNPGSRGEEVTSHFSSNVGAHYKFGVVVKTSCGFDQAAAPVLEALGRLTWAGKDATDRVREEAKERNFNLSREFKSSEFEDFNEELILGYFEGSRIGYHDDGEDELGPTVATLSLGSPSYMKFRPKKHTTIGEPTGNKENERKEILGFVLTHGDMVVMHGREIHKFYEHAVDAGGVLRFAMTCRYIRPDKITDRARRLESIKNGQVPEEWKRRAYKGEEDDADDDMDNDVNDEREDVPDDEMVDIVDDVVEKFKTTSVQPGVPQSDSNPDLDGETPDSAATADMTVDVNGPVLESTPDSPAAPQDINQTRDSQNQVPSSVEQQQFINYFTELRNMALSNPGLIASFSMAEKLFLANFSKQLQDEI